MSAPAQNGLFADGDAGLPSVRSTLKLPPKKWLAHFHMGMVDNDRVRDYLENGYSLGICCRDCKRLVEVTPPELLARYGDRIGLRIRDLGARLACKGNGGCGSHDVAIFPHLYDDAAWRWAPAIVA